MKVPDTTPLTPAQRTALESLMAGATPEQVAWLSGFLGGALAYGGAPAAGAPAAAVGGADLPPLTVLFGTESGNCEALADETRKRASAEGWRVQLWNMAETMPADLAKASRLLVIVSTWGDGDPPDAAVPFYEGLLNDSMPKLGGVRFSVCALGDTSYEHFCKTGKDIDARLEALGADRILGRADCDVDFDEPYAAWVEAVLSALRGEVGGAAGVPAVPAAAAPAEYGKKNPFPARLLDRILLNGTGSEKETYHLELSLAGSGLRYAPGDALAVVPTNCPDDVAAVLEAGGLDGDEAVALKDGSEKPLRDALLEDYDITGLGKTVLQKYNALAKHSGIDNLLDPGNAQGLSEYLWGRQLVDVLEEFPATGLSGQALTSMLRRLPPRLYSIASSLLAHPDEVHLTVAAVRFESHGRPRRGVASTYCADRVEVGKTMSVYTHANRNFKLPGDGDTPVVMVGPGTGVAPFRAFVEERAALGAKGKNWLIFGDQRSTFDFLYQLEWQEHLRKGSLAELDVAFSRDQGYKVYVQHRIAEKSRQLYAWLEEGAHFYVCGDASRMAGDVHDALVAAVAKEGVKSDEEAEEYVAALKKAKRYQRDVY